MGVTDPVFGAPIRVYATTQPLSTPAEYRAAIAVLLDALAQAGEPLFTREDVRFLDGVRFTMEEDNFRMDSLQDRIESLLPPEDRRREADPMQRIYKYEIATVSMQDVSLPVDARVLSVQEQRGVLCMWALGNQDGPIRLRRVHVIGTGEAIERADGVDYVGTVQVSQGRLVRHIFVEHWP